MAAERSLACTVDFATGEEGGMVGNPLVPSSIHRACQHGTIVPAKLFLNIDQLSFDCYTTGDTGNPGNWLRAGRFRKPFPAKLAARWMPGLFPEKN